MVLGAAYLMWMYQRVVFGELSDFLKNLGHHLTDITPTELLTLTPLVALTVALRALPRPRAGPAPRSPVSDVARRHARLTAHCRSMP